MHYVTHRSHRMQKHKFSITCPIALVVKSIQVPPQHEKLCIDVLRSGLTEMHYVTHSSHWMQNYKFDITCLDTLLVEPFRSYPSMKNSASKFNDPDSPK
jgi:hypothetical protein